MSDNKVIDFFEANDKLWTKEHRKVLDYIIDSAISLATLKIQGMQVSGENEPTIIKDIPYTKEEICEAVFKANDYIVDNHSPNNINKITSLTDELSRLAVEYLLGKKINYNR